MHRVFVPKDEIPYITGSDAHQIKDVLRMKVSDPLELLDGSGTSYLAEIAEIKKDKILCKILSSRQDKSEPKTKVTLAQCLPKARKMELIVQKCTELGVNTIIPVLSERTVGKSAKRERWQKIAKEAAEQCGRGALPEIANLQTFEEILKSAKHYNLALIPWELETEKTLKKTLKTSPSPKLLILIGPEGGFSQKEVELAKRAGFISVSLGPRILRTETAGLAILSMINYEYEQ